MRIKVAEHIGFCFGVKRAISIAEKTIREAKKGRAKICSLGPIIHNPQVVGKLGRKGLNVVTDIEGIKKGTVVVSSHGAPLEVIEEIKKKKLKLVDATCPFVKYAQNITKELKTGGYKIYIAGDRHHPEVKALLSIAGRNRKTKKLGIISQTTQNKENYISGILYKLSGDFNEVRIFNTICNDTSRRQESTRNLLKDCDVMIIVGGKNSANTRRLYQICQERGMDSYHIETEDELDKSCFIGKKCVGVVSGASTPDSTVKRVVARIKKLSKDTLEKKS